ncbi:hypothetical protein ACQKLX_02865 [Bosea sp. NPDC003192]|uniref:hypothetical protein n=1 Tax=Bosea sp. NPDC003192 TaxID=3390551 RepID=UPI003CFF6A06
MTDIDRISEWLSDVFDKALPSIDNNEKHTAQILCFIVLFHAKTEIESRANHLKAQQCLLALEFFRSFGRNFRQISDNRFIEMAYMASAVLDESGIDKSDYISMIVRRLISQIGFDRAKALLKIVKDHVDNLLSYSPRDEYDGWRAVNYMISGENYIGAKMKVDEQKILRDKLKAFIEEREIEKIVLIGKSLPNFGSLVISPGSARASFGSGGGSVSLVGDKLSVILPSS